MKLQTNNLVPKEHNVVLITGDGKTFPSDLEMFLSWGVPHDVMAIGRSINHYQGKVLHWANVDGTDSSWWAKNLPLKNDGKLPIRHSIGKAEGYDIDWEIIDPILWDPEEVLWHGSTALFAVYISLAIGYEKIVLAGCPLDSKGHFYFADEHYGPRWTPESYQAWFEFARTDESRKVRSLSGYTAQIVGEPSKEWLWEGNGR